MMNDDSPYALLARLTAEIEQDAEAGHWEAAALTTGTLLAQLKDGDLPSAAVADRPAIEAALRNIAAITERAEPLREDMARLLKAFGPPAAQS